jgi:hypothetical protein
MSHFFVNGCNKKTYDITGNYVINGNTITFNGNGTIIFYDSNTSVQVKFQMVNQEIQEVQVVVVVLVLIIKVMVLVQKVVEH